jgi:hypothetical protein
VEILELATLSFRMLHYILFLVAIILTLRLAGKFGGVLGNVLRAMLVFLALDFIGDLVSMATEAGLVLPITEGWLDIVFDIGGILLVTIFVFIANKESQFEKQQQHQQPKERKTK